MNSELFAISEYCSLHQVDPSFITSLQNEGLIHITFTDNDPYIEAGQLRELEIFTRWHQDLGINIEGIDVVRNLLQKVKDIQSEMNALRNRLQLYEDLGE